MSIFTIIGMTVTGLIALAFVALICILIIDFIGYQKGARNTVTMATMVKIAVDGIGPSMVSRPGFALSVAATDGTSKPPIQKTTTSTFVSMRMARSLVMPLVIRGK